MAKRTLKDWLESSPWVLLAGVVAAVLTFLMSAAQQGWALYEKATATKVLPSIEVAGQRGYYLVPPTPEALKIPAVKSVLEGEEFLAPLVPTKITGKAPIWPVQLLVLNPTKEKLTLHTCRMLVYAPKMKLPAFSFGYFVSDTLELRSKDFERLVTVDAEGAQHVQLIFLLADIHHRQYDEPEFFSKPGQLDISCKDQARRDVKTQHTFYSRLQARIDR